MIGMTLGHYRVNEQLGRGGMGEVYTADDLNLNRKVALKFLPDAFSGDPERMARFEREARLLASLNHPNIAAIYGLEQAEGKRFIVMELVEGETLAQRISKGALPVDDALAICSQIAEGLEAAHEKGVIHRDLKPANVMITEGDKVKILDFGLAKALSDDTQNVDGSQSPTLTEAMTRPGVILGTAAYMSPEQAKGKAVDKRADIWAFGCILYECLTGKRAFEGETVTETLAAVLTKEPDLAKAPTKMHLLLRRCFEKDPRKRLRDIGDAVLEADSMSKAAAEHRPVYRHPLVWLLEFIAIAALAALAYVLWNRPSSDPATVTRLSITLPPNQVLTDYPAISPDGQTVAYISQKGTDEPLLYTRKLNSYDSRVISGSGSAQQPFFSPDGKWIAFFADGKLQKAEVAGGSPIKLADAPIPFGGTWNQDDTILFTTEIGSGLFRIPANGGAPESLTKPDGAGQGYAHVWPQALPDGRRVLFTIWGKPGGDAMLSLESRKWEIIDRSRYPASLFCLSTGTIGHLLNFGHNDIKAAPIDLAHPTAIRASASVLEDVYFSERNARSTLAVSEIGTIVYAQGNPTKRSLVWVNHEGKAEPLSKEQGLYLDVSLAPDGSRAAVIQMPDIWIYDLRRLGTRTRKTLGSEIDGDNYFPIWSRDGKRIYFQSNRTGDWDIYSQLADGSQPAEVLLRRADNQAPNSFSPDGTLFFSEFHHTTGTDIWALSPDGKTTPIRVSPYNEGEAIASPDGRWIAYQSDESGRSEIYLQSYPSGEKRVPISSEGGTLARWSPDGKALFYIAGNTMMMVSMTRDGSSFSSPHALFDCSGYQNTSYDVSPDGKRFLMIRRDEGSVPRQLNVILGFSSELNRLVPVRKQ